MFICGILYLDADAGVERNTDGGKLDYKFKVILGHMPLLAPHLCSWRRLPRTVSLGPDVLLQVPNLLVVKFVELWHAAGNQKAFP